MTLVAFGDSHAGTVRENVDRVVSIPGLTLHRFGRPTWVAETIEEYGLSDTVVVFAGEVDVRCHFARGVEERGLPAVVDTHVAWALSGLGALRERGIRVGLVAVIPPIDHAPDPAFPVAGSLADRAAWTVALNDGLRLVLHALRVPFVEPYGSVTRSDGTLDPRASDGTVHLSRDAARLAFSDLAERLG